MKEFTKGPWVIDAGEKSDRSHLITTNNRSVINNMAPICEIETDFIGEFGVEQKANAHLIAMAPDMYAMIDEVSKLRESNIEDAVQWVLDNTDGLIDLLKKARGE